MKQCQQIISKEDMNKFQKPVIFHFNPETNMYLSKNNFKIESPREFQVLSLPSKFNSINLEEMLDDKTFKKQIEEVLRLIPKEFKVSKSSEVQGFRTDLIIPLLCPKEYQSKFLANIIKIFIKT